MQKTIKNIYNHLQDEYSKTIFENRLLYSLTNEQKFINNIVNHSYPIEEYRRRVKSFFKDTAIVIYGAGYVGYSFLCVCEEVEIIAFCDSAKEKHGKTHGGHKIISPAELREGYIDNTIVIAAFDDSTISEIHDILTNSGISKEKIVSINSVIDLAVRLRRAYFSPEIILPLIKNDEIFVDAGCYDFKTSIRFAEYSGGNYEKMIAFEPNPKQYHICVENSKTIKNITMHPYGLWNECTELYFDNSGIPGGAHVSDKANEHATKIKTVRLDDILNGEKATFIKMDIEGAELNALKGAEQTILKYRPKLAICVYHKLEDIWEIPAYILSLNSDYKLYLRHYSLAEGETVLYAV